MVERRELTPEELQARASALYELAVRVSANCEYIGTEPCESCTYIEVCKEVRKEDWSFTKEVKKKIPEEEEKPSD